MKVVFEFQEVRPLARPQGVLHSFWANSLIFHAEPESGAALASDAQDAAVQVHAELSAAIDKARTAETPLTKVCERRRADLLAAQERLAGLEGMPAVLAGQFQQALRAGDTEAADEAEAELISTRVAVESARHRVELLRGLADESEQAVASEAQRVIASVRRQKHAELKKAADAARARLNAAVSEHFPAVIIAEEALRAVSN